VRALADARLFDAAAAVALGASRTGTRVDHLDRGMGEVVAYARFLRAVSAVTDAYYRRVAVGDRDTVAWRAQMTAAMRTAWPHLVADGRSRGFDPAVFAGAIDRRFGAVMNVGTTAGTLDLHMGHRVVDEQRTVQQYGHTAAVRFVSLDAMTSNGYQSWAWNGRAAHGGWGGEGLIVQVRSAYATQPIQAWREVSDSGAIRREGTRIARDSIADQLHARTDSVAYFPSVAARLRRRGLLALRDSLQATGLGGDALSTAFVQEEGRDERESSIFAHEGRHAIDGALGIAGPAAELEFRAKLSEVAFAPRPALAFGAIMDDNVGDGTPHGAANRRVLTGIATWMRTHAAEISGFDPTAPTLPQLPLLSNAQLRAAAMAQDPLAHPGQQP
jgi:hypothetical protein